MRRSLRARLVGSYVLLALLTVAAAGVVAQGLVAREVARRQAATLQDNVESLAAEALPFLWPAPREAALSELARSASFLLDARVEIEAADGRTVADSGAVDEPSAFLLFDDQAIDVRELSHLGAILETHGPSHAVPAWVHDLASQGAEGDERAFRVFIRREGGPWGSRLDFDWMAHGAQRVEREGPPVGTITLGEGALDVEFESEGAAPRVRVKALELPELLGAPGTATLIEGKPPLTGAVARLEKGPPVVVEAMRFVGPSEGSVEARSSQAVRHPFALRGTPATARLPAPVAATIGDPAAPLGRVRISEGADLRPAALAATRHAFSWAALVAALVAAVAGLVVARGMSAPLSALADTAGRMAEGDLSARATPRGEDEIARLARQFNHMADELEENFDALAAERDALRRFIADASHELRTPITALRNFNELLRGHAEGDPEARVEFLAESAVQLDRLEWITAHLLDLSRLEAGLIELDAETVEAKELLEAAAAPFRPQATARGMEIRVDAEPELPPLRVDRGRLILALSNLVDNALRHTPDGGAVHLSAEEGSSGLEVDTGGPILRLVVEDDGPGVPPDERPRIFERFYRGRGAPPGGTGLGLAIVDGVARAHGGVVAVTDAVDGGARFELRLPVG